MEEKVELLLSEFSMQRRAIMDMINEVEQLRGKMELLFPENIDSRTRRFLEDKVKTMVSFYNVLLDMRKEISKSIKDELEIRRKAEGGNLEIDDIEEMLDIRDLAGKVEKFEKKRRKIQDNRLEEQDTLKELVSKGIDIPGMKELNDLEEGD